MQQKLGIRMCKAVCRTVKCTVFDNLTAAHHHHTVCKIMLIMLCKAYMSICFP